MVRVSGRRTVRCGNYRAGSVARSPFHSRANYPRFPRALSGPVINTRAGLRHRKNARSFSAHNFYE